MTLGPCGFIGFHGVPVCDEEHGDPARRPLIALHGAKRFGDDVAELIDRLAGGGPVDVWAHSLGVLTATSLAVRHPAKVRRLVLAASDIRPDAYHPDITASVVPSLPFASCAFR